MQVPTAKLSLVASLVLVGGALFTLLATRASEDERGSSSPSSALLGTGENGGLDGSDAAGSRSEVGVPVVSEPDGLPVLGATAPGDSEPEVGPTLTEASDGIIDVAQMAAALSSSTSLTPLSPESALEMSKAMVPVLEKNYGMFCAAAAAVAKGTARSGFRDLAQHGAIFYDCLPTLPELIVQQKVRAELKELADVGSNSVLYVVDLDRAELAVQVHVAAPHRLLRIVIPHSVTSKRFWEEIYERRGVPRVFRNSTIPNVGTFQR